MINKYVLSRSQNVRFVQEHLDEFIENNLALSRYVDDDPERSIAFDNFKRAYDFILNSPEVKNDYICLQKLHTILMEGLDNGIKAELTQTQIDELSLMIDQPTKGNTEVSIDVMLYILDKRLFTDGDVRAALLFANKIMIDRGNGFITVPKNHKDTFREKLKEYKENKNEQLKDWIYKYCIKGPKVEY